MSEDSDQRATAFQLTLRTVDDDVEPEVWRATIHSGGVTRFGGEPGAAEATVYRVHYANPRWAEQLQDAEADLTSISSAFVDRELISLLDESSLFTDNLCVIASIHVEDARQGPSLSHELVRSIARVFDGDTIALLTARRTGNDGATGFWADRAHWAAIGFVDIPGTTSMILPVGARS
ncbi:MULTISPECIES: hypothetical protein [Microbacterium]|uniref:hypothetical protein n=1 Tax=Microbacterium TaxID=33882 RepID=UPI000E273598|nr:MULTISPECIES: hypothetical protein [Microbacterium]MDZ5143344.1 hypothetical protein [Microbacterium testaceum]REC99432.1 hypothetical protein DEU35_0407 [Microbacterium sp. AG157]